MTIEKIIDGKNLTLVLEGRLDAMTARDLEAEVKANTDGVDKLIFDIAKLDYMASAGLRVLTAAQRAMKKQGEMIILHPNDTVRETFEVTGLCDVFDIRD